MGKKEKKARIRAKRQKKAIARSESLLNQKVKRGIFLDPTLDDNLKRKKKKGAPTTPDSQQVISQYHTLNKQLAAVDHDPSLDVEDKEQKKKEIQEEMEKAGGLPRYQEASMRGQTIPFHKFNTKKFVLRELLMIRDGITTRKKKAKGRGLEYKRQVIQEKVEALKKQREEKLAKGEIVDSDDEDPDYEPGNERVIQKYLQELQEMEDKKHKEEKKKRKREEGEEEKDDDEKDEEKKKKKERKRKR